MLEDRPSPRRTSIPTPEAQAIADDREDQGTFAFRVLTRLWPIWRDQPAARIGRALDDRDLDFLEHELLGLLSSIWLYRVQVVERFGDDEAALAFRRQVTRSYERRRQLEGHPAPKTIAEALREHGDG